MIGTSWTHLLARRMVKPLLGTWVRPNHLTTLRLITGVAACLLFSLGTRAGMGWAGGLWLLSAFLDRADGELARIGNMMSPGGHRYDYYCLVTGASMVLCCVFVEWLELRSAPAPEPIPANGALTRTMRSI